MNQNDKDERKAFNPKLDEDLRKNPGIGQSPGTFATGESIEAIEGANTVEGDLDNDSTATDGVDTARTGRTNK